MKQLGVELVRGRVKCGTDLRLDGYDDVFVLGDAAAVPDLTAEDPGSALCPPTAQHATRQAVVAADNVVASLRGESLREYKHHDLGLVVDLGGTQAVAHPLKLRLTGMLAQAVTRGYHLYALPLTRTRARVVANWILHFFGGRRLHPHRLPHGAQERDVVLRGDARLPLGGGDREARRHRGGLTRAVTPPDDPEYREDLLARDGTLLRRWDNGAQGVPVVVSNGLGASPTAWPFLQRCGLRLPRDELAPPRSRWLVAPGRRDAHRRRRPRRRPVHGHGRGRDAAGPRRRLVGGRRGRDRGRPARARPRRGPARPRRRGDGGVPGAAPALAPAGSGARERAPAGRADRGVAAAGGRAAGGGADQPAAAEHGRGPRGPRARRRGPGAPRPHRLRARR